MKYFYLIICCLYLIFPGCSKKESVITSPPAVDTTHYVIKPQYDIPWPTLAQTAWPKALHDAQCTGRSSFNGPSKGRVKLEIPLDTYTSDAIMGSDSVFYITSDTNFFAITLNGTRLWNVYLKIIDLPNENPPMINADGVIYIGDYNGISAYNSNGTLIWHSQLDGRVLLKSSAIDLDGNIYTITNSGTLYAIDPIGSILWQLNAPIGQFGWGDSQTISFTPDGSRFYVGGSTKEQSLYLINTKGEILRIDSLGGKQTSAISVDVDGNVYSYFENDIVSISSIGAERWRISNVGSNWNVTIDPDGNIAYLSFGYFYSVDNNGKKRWGVKVHGLDDITHIVCDAQGTNYIETSDDLKNYDVQAISNTWKILWTLTVEAYVKEAGPSLTKEGYLLFPHSNYLPGTKHMYVIE